MFFTASITMKVIMPPVHVREMGEAALVTNGRDQRGSFFYFYGFGFVLWESNKLKGKGEMREEKKDRDETFRR